MGFSVAASSSIIFIGLIISAATVFAVMSDTMNDLGNSLDDSSYRSDEMEETSVALKDYWFNTTVLTVNLTNFGTTQLHVDKVIVQANGTLINGEISNTSVNGNQVTNIWNPQETLTINFDRPTSPGEVLKIDFENRKDLFITLT